MCYLYERCQKSLRSILRMEKELLYKYFAGDTTTEEEVRIMDWAEESPENYRKYLEERKLWNALLIHYDNNIEQEKKRIDVSHGRRFNLWKVACMAASFALLLTVSWMLYINNSAEENLQSVIVPAGHRVQLVLEDGTKVWLNSKTKLTYPTNFGDKIREVSLDGEGFFEVTHNEKKPFIVKTKKYDIKVLGTTFNVYAYNSHESVFETSLLHGSVDVSSNSTSHHVLLKTREKVTEINGILQKSNIDNLDRYRWKDGLLCLDDVPFAELMSKFSAYYDIQINIENPTVLDYRCTGKFRQNDGVEYALKVIQKDLKFNYVRDDESNTITIN